MDCGTRRICPTTPGDTQNSPTLHPALHPVRTPAEQRHFDDGWHSRDAEIERLRASVQDYENAITWDTTCLNCSKLMDSNYEQHCEIERLRAEVAAARASVDYWVSAATERGNDLDALRAEVARLEQEAAEATYPNHAPSTALANYRAGREVWDTNGDPW